MDRSLREVFEEQLHAAWQDRNFDAWLEARSIYADYLEEQDDPLFPMARCPLRMHAVTSRLRNGGKRPWMWRLYFDLPDTLEKPRPRWWASQRVNGKQLLGLPPFTLRCKGWEDETRTVRFTVIFRPRESKRAVRVRDTSIHSNGWGYILTPVAMDTDLHPAGFAALWWPGERTPARWGESRRPDQKLLFAE